MYPDPRFHGRGGPDPLVTWLWAIAILLLTGLGAGGVYVWQRGGLNGALPLSTPGPTPAAPIAPVALPPTVEPTAPITPAPTPTATALPRVITAPSQAPVTRVIEEAPEVREPVKIGQVQPQPTSTPVRLKVTPGGPDVLKIGETQAQERERLARERGQGQTKVGSTQQ